MKFTDLIHAVVVAFNPKRRPVYALAALFMFLAAFVAVAWLGGSGAGAMIKAIAAAG